MDSLRIVLSCLATAARHPRVWLTAWLVVTLPALLLVFPVFMELRDNLDQHPGATFALNQHLDLDFARAHPEATVRAGGAVLFMILAWTFLGGGILATVGVGRRFRFSEMLAEGGRLFARNLRAVIGLLVLALLLFWGVDAFDGWLRTGLLRDSSNEPLSILGWSSPVLTPRMGLEVLQWGYGLLFLILLFASKLARARLCLYDRRSAILAWSRAVGTMVRRPVRTFMVVALLALVLWAVPAAIGLAMGWFGEDLLPMLVLGQAGVVWYQIVLIAFFLSARRMVADADARPEMPAEPTVVLPRREKRPEREIVRA